METAHHKILQSIRSFHSNVQQSRRVEKNHFLKTAYLNCSESWFIVWTICFMELDFKTISISVERKAAM